jgi:hypothetical protein
VIHKFINTRASVKNALDEAKILVEVVVAQRKKTEAALSSLGKQKPFFDTQNELQRERIRYEIEEIDKHEPYLVSERQSVLDILSGIAEQDRAIHAKLAHMNAVSSDVNLIYKDAIARSAQLKQYADLLKSDIERISRGDAPLFDFDKLVEIEAFVSDYWDFGEAFEYYSQNVRPRLSAMAYESPQRIQIFREQSGRYTQRVSSSVHPLPRKDRRRELAATIQEKLGHFQGVIDAMGIFLRFYDEQTNVLQHRRAGIQQQIKDNDATRIGHEETLLNRRAQRAKLVIEFNVTLTSDEILVERAKERVRLANVAVDKANDRFAEVALHFEKYLPATSETKDTLYYNVRLLAALKVGAEELIDFMISRLCSAFSHDLGSVRNRGDFVNKKFSERLQDVQEQTTRLNSEYQSIQSLCLSVTSRPEFSSYFLDIDIVEISDEE